MLGVRELAPAVLLAPPAQPLAGNQDQNRPIRINHLQNAISKSFPSIFLQIEGIGVFLWGCPRTHIRSRHCWAELCLALSNDPAGFGGRRG